MTDATWQAINTRLLGAANEAGVERGTMWRIDSPVHEPSDSSLLLDGVRVMVRLLKAADRGFNGYRYWQAACATGAQLLWRCAANRQLPVVTALPDGSYLSTIYPDPKSRRKQTDGITLRVIEYSLPGKPQAQPRYRLLTTLLDPRRAPALELAALYQ